MKNFTFPFSLTRFFFIYFYNRLLKKKSRATAYTTAEQHRSRAAIVLCSHKFSKFSSILRLFRLLIWVFARMFLFFSFHPVSTFGTDGRDFRDLIVMMNEKWKFFCVGHQRIQTRHFPFPCAVKMSLNLNRIFHHFMIVCEREATFVMKYWIIHKMRWWLMVMISLISNIWSWDRWWWTLVGVERRSRNSRKWRHIRSKSSVFSIRVTHHVSRTPQCSAQ